MQQTLGDRVREGFSRAFGGSPHGVVRAPGRINLIGEHTDYNDGFALPMAIDLETRIAWRHTGDDTIKVVALDRQDERDTFSRLIRPERVGGWRDYVRGSFAAMLDRGVPVAGAELAIAGTIPQGNGLSSSASLEIATIHALCAVSEAATPAPKEVALLAQSAENEFVGVNCGVLDQLAIASGEQGAGLLIDCRSLEVQPVPMPSDVAVLMVPSGVERGLVDGAYNKRRAECAAAADALEVSVLRDADRALLESHRERLDPVLYRRAAHVIAENKRVIRFAEALSASNLSAAGRLLGESHASLRDLFEVSHPDVDHLVAVLQEAIGEEGGARMTGGGFGGAVVALVRTANVQQAFTAVERFHASKGVLAEPAAVHPSRGAGPIGEEDLPRPFLRW